MAHAHKIDRVQKVNLKEIDTDPPKGMTKEEALAETQKLASEMEELLDLLFFAGQHSLLLVLQGMDTSGKDGTIRHFLNYTHAQSCRVASFKVPTAHELAHDFLWRIHQQAPGKGEIAVFNRSHYEDVLVVRVHELVPKDVWHGRYAQINTFESLLTASNTIVLKFFLHISKKEQEERLLDREKEVEKAWKLSVGDWKEREQWSRYQEAYEDAIGKCASAEAPWHVVPADHKWYRNLAVTEAIVHALRPYKKTWLKDLTEVGEKAKAELSAFRSGKP